MTTLASYGAVAPHRQADLIRDVASQSKANSVDVDLVAQVMAEMKGLARDDAA